MLLKIRRGDGHTYSRSAKKSTSVGQGGKTPTFFNHLTIMKKMDELQVQHAFDRIEEHLAEIKEAALNSNPDRVDELEDRISDLEEELSSKENEVERIESELDDYQAAVRDALPKLQSFLGDLSRDHPTYDISDLEDAILTLESI